MHSQVSQTVSRARVERGIYRRRTREGATRYEIAFQDGEGRQRWRTVATLREARLLRADLISKVDRGEVVASSRATLREFAEEWLESQKLRLRPNTHSRYEINLRLHVLPRLGRRRLSEVRVDDVARVIAELEQEGKAGWTIRGVLTVLSRVLGTAERRGLITTNPVGKLERAERPKVERREIPALDRAAIGRLITNAPGKYRTLIAVSVLTGVRQSEALGLRWQDVDVHEGVIRVRRQCDRHGTLVEPKTRAAKREIPIPASLARMLAEHRLASRHSADGDFVFASAAGTPLAHRNIVRRGLEPALEEARLPRMRWHDLRDLAASVLIAEGASVVYVSRVLGHANPSITLSIYAHEFARAEHADRTRERMEQAFGDLLR